MSRCISSHGEYSEHTFPTLESARGEDRFTCTLCGVFDEWEALDALRTAEAIAEAAREYVATQRCFSDDEFKPADVRRAVEAHKALYAAVDAERAGLERGEAHR